MKARIRHTNIEVDVQPFYSDGQFVGFSDKGISGYCTYTKEDLIFPDATDCTNIDWQAFRREAAKDFVCAMLQDTRISYSQPYEWFCEQAIKLADELVKQLRGV